MTRTGVAQKQIDDMAAMIDKAARESLRLYRPMPWQLPVHECQSPEVIIRGGKQAGKSVCAAHEFASRVLGIPIIGPDGPIPLKYPVSTKEDPRTYWVIGIDVTHIGKTIWRLLCERGMRTSMRCIRDLDTHEWRMANNTDPIDNARWHETVLTEPVLPPRFIEKITYEDAGKHIFRTIELYNGAMIVGFASTSNNPGMGDACDGIWINEDIANPAFIPEWQDRLYTRNGWFMWDAWPQMRNDAIVRMIDRAEACKDEPNPVISAFQLIASQNLYVSPEAKRNALARMDTEEEIARRDRGELVMSPYQIYDFSPHVHVISKDQSVVRSVPKTPEEMLKWLYSADGHLPDEWTRYLAIDPSHTRTGIVSAVVTPSEYRGIRLGHRLIVEWELVAKRKRADELAELLKQKMCGRRYEAFVMDMMKGRQTSALEGRNTFQAASEGLKALGIKSRTTGFDFVPGLAKPLLRIQMVREMMGGIDDGLPVLLFLDQDIRELAGEFRGYCKKVVVTHSGGETISDEPANPRKYDLMAALEYLVGHVWPLLKAGIAYREPDPEDVLADIPPWVRQMMEKHRNQIKPVHLGPGLAM